MEHPGLDPVYNHPIHKRVLTRRVILYTGFKCNLRCQFCYYLKSLEEGTAKNFSFESLARKIKLARWFGKDDIDFTGGEATLHKDFEKLLRTAKSSGYKTINVITNGWRLSDREVYRRFAEAGLNETLFSLHSHIEEVHDRLTQKKGSHKKILEAIENANSLGVRVRINMVVNPMNYQHVGDFLEFTKKLKPAELNFIVFNPSEETAGYDNHQNVRLSSYKEIGAALSKAIREHKKDFPAINVRFMPFCYMKGMEGHIRTYWQEIYESQEWDPVLHWAFRKNFVVVLGAAVLGFGASILKSSPVFFGKKGIYTFLCELFQSTRTLILFRHKSKCRQCSLRRICPGLPKEFVQKNPDAEVFPYLTDESPPILNPVYFGQIYPAKFRSIASPSDG